MKKASVLFLTAVLCVTAFSARAENYTGEYEWLRFWHVQADWSDRYWNSWGNYRMAWLAARGDGSNTADRYYTLTWDEPMDLTGARVNAFTQATGGSIGTYTLQYSVDGKTKWEDIDTYNRSTGLPVTLSGTTDYNLTFGNMPEGGVKAIRVLFPAGNYDQGTAQNGPGIQRLLPTGNVASGLGLDPSDPAFNILGTTLGDHFLGINPSVSLTSNRTYGTNQYNDGTASSLLDHNLTYDTPGRTGWISTVIDGSETIICDLGVPLTVHSVSLYTGTGYQYLPATLDVYVSDDLDKLRDDLAAWRADMAAALANEEPLPTKPDGFIGTAAKADDVLALSGFDAVGQYVVLTNPPVTGGSYHFLMHQLAVNATPVVPEPATVALLALGGLALLRRRT